MNDYCVNITETIVLEQFQFYHLSNLFEDHASIVRIKSSLDNVSDKIDSKKVHEREVKREIMNLQCYTSQTSWTIFRLIFSHNL